MRRHGRFCPVRINREGAQILEWRAYRSRLELGLIVSLLIMIVLFVASKRFNARMQPVVYMIGDNFWAMDLPPLTKSGGAPRPPTLPQVPIASEDESIPEEETIDLTELDLSVGLFTTEGLGPNDSGRIGGGDMGPRPLREVIPEYPDDLRKKGIEGVVLLSILVNEHGRVDSVHVVGNTSGNKRLERAAVQAARSTLYMPARQTNGKRSLWIKRPYTFEGK